MEMGLVKSLSSYEMDSATRVQILDVVVCNSFNANVLGKSMNLSPLSLLPSHEKIVRQVGFFYPWFG